MLSNNIKPTIVTFNTIIDAYVRAKDMDNAWNIFEDLLKNSIQPDNFTLSTLFRGIRLPSHRQYLNKGLDIVNSLSNSNQVADVILINVLLDSCIALKESKRIKEIFNEVREGKFKGVTGTVARYQGQQGVGIVIDGLLTVATAYVPSVFLKKSTLLE